MLICILGSGRREGEEEKAKGKAERESQEKREGDGRKEKREREKTGRREAEGILTSVGQSHALALVTIGFVQMQMQNQRLYTKQYEAVRTVHCPG